LGSSWAASSKSISPAVRQLARAAPWRERQRVARVADHPLHGGLERRAEALGVQFADEELGDVLGQVAVRVGAAGHAEAIERVDAAALEAERLEEAAERLLAARQGPVVGRRATVRSAPWSNTSLQPCRTASPT
jgi:hypothetical protein